MFDHVFQAIFSVISQVHKYRNARSELDEFLLNLLAFALVFFLLLREFLLLFRRKVVAFLLLGVLHVLRLVDDGLDVGVQVAEALDVHQGLHRLGIVHQTLKSGIIHVDQHGAFPAAGQQRCRGPAHRHIQHAGCVNFLHGRTVEG